MKKKRDPKFEVVPNRLRELRKKAGLSNEKLVLIFKEKYNIDISKVTLQKYEVTEFPHAHYGSVEGMRLEYLYMFADFYNVSADYLLGRTDNPTPDMNMRGACDYTGLSEEAVKSLEKITNMGDIHKKVLSLFIENESFQESVNCVVQTIVESMNIMEGEKMMASALPQAVEFVKNASPDAVMAVEQYNIACQSANIWEYPAIAEKLGMNGVEMMEFLLCKAVIENSPTPLELQQLWEVRYSKAMHKLRDSILFG